MPELPEVETIRRELDREVSGKRIKSVEVHGLRSIRRNTSKKQFTSRLEGAKIKSAQRRGKYLLLDLDTGDVLVIHLRMSGQLLKALAREPMPKHTHVVFTFTTGGQLRFVDPRTFGELFVAARETLVEEVPELADLGFDPVDEPMSWVRFGELLVSRKAKLKGLIMDQTFVAGIGNIYSDEILWDAGLRHDRSSDSLSSMEIRRLYRSVVEILHEAVKHRGSTLTDQQYVDLHGRPGQFQLLHQVYDREAQACRRCRSPIVRAKFQGRSTFYCEHCQV
ncbi:MAG: bifunctional DNA-formamidopyrimidine glycosylase/DNA-(apurinic or apyrimidinic site) lyase [Acidimicrobiales bacterium]